MQTVRVAVDAMSGDYGPSVVLRGIWEARQKCPEPFVVHACGDPDAVRTELSNLAAQGYTNACEDDFFIIESCTDIIETDDVPSRAWMSKEKSSIVRTITLQKEGCVRASVSAGDSGILMSAALFILGRQEDVSRPALAALLPTTGSHQALLLDVGANLDCRPRHLCDFAVAGSRYAEQMLHLSSPKVALLNVGRERTKGTKTIRETDEILRAQPCNYIGYIEGNQVLLGDADVVVCDGFTGNILLKTCESYHRIFQAQALRGESSARSVIDAIAIMNPDNYGAVPFLGINGIVYKAHGASSASAIAQALRAAVRAACCDSRERSALPGKAGMRGII